MLSPRARSFYTVLQKQQSKGEIYLGQISFLREHTGGRCRYPGSSKCNVFEVWRWSGGGLGDQQEVREDAESDRGVWVGGLLTQDGGG